MIASIQHLPNWYNIFSQKNFAVYVIHDNTVHLMGNVKKEMLKRGYNLIYWERSDLVCSD